MAAQLSSLSLVAATRKGGLDAYTTSCSCGMVISSSLRTLAEQDAAEHLRWHERRGR